jgi:FixJ family two-component response regulator
MRALRPDLPIAIMSGFSEDLTAEKLDRENLGVFLQKPFRRADLARALEEALGSS